MSKKLLCLRNIDLYAGISEEELIRLTEEAVEQYLDQGFEFYREGEVPEGIYVIKEGEVELIQERDDKVVVLETLFPGDVFGNFGLGEPSTHKAIVRRKTYICQTPTDEFLDIVKAHPEMAFRLMQALAEKTHYYEEKLAEAHLPAEDKLLAEIKRLSEKNSRRILGKFFKIPLVISHQRLAEKTGLNRVTVTKLMKKLRESGRIEVDEGTGEIRVNKTP